MSQMPSSKFLNNSKPINADLEFRESQKLIQEAKIKQQSSNQGQTIQIGQSPPVDASKLVRFTFFMGLGLGALITVIIYKIRK